MTAGVSSSHRIASKSSCGTCLAERSPRRHQANVKVSHAAAVGKPTPSVLRRSCHRPRMLSQLRCLLLAIYFSVVFCCSAVDARHVKVLRGLDSPSELLFDRSDPPKGDAGRHTRHQTTTATMRLTTAILAPTTTQPLDHSPTHSPTTTTTSTTSPALQTDPAVPSSSLPRPFDGSLGNNFTAPSCPAFFHQFLHDELFNQCLPLSLLLQTSNSFFAATRSPPLLTKTLDATCSVDFPRYNSLMTNLSVEIQSTSTCGKDLGLQNPLVQQAYNGFVAYAPLYHAGCLTESTASTSPSFINTNNNKEEEGEQNTISPAQEYCFVAAATNASAPTSSYVYYVPLGVQLPGGTMPSCNACLKATMGIFRAYAALSTQLLHQDYSPAAQQIDLYCGPQFVSAAVAATSSAVRVGPGPWGWVAGLLILWAFFSTGWI